MFEHSDTDSILIIGGSSDKESMQQFINNPFYVRTDLKLVSCWQMQCATCLHSKFPNLWVFIVKII